MTSGDYTNIKNRDNDREEEMIPLSPSARKRSQPDSQIG
jgi:hypothetical protein